jgi:alpha-tubulin suppressor-like RCC1 family protein
LLSDNTVQCWGGNGYKQIGTLSPNQRFSVSPVLINGLASADLSQIATSEFNTCALFSNNVVQCWGDNSNGQLGNGSFGGTTATPTTVNGILPGTILQIASQAQTTCVLLSTQTIQCWGLNSSAQLGNNSSQNSATPVTVILK